MITYFKKNGTRPDPQTLLGKFVFKEAGALWTAYGRPGLVTEVKGSRLYRHLARMDRDMSGGLLPREEWDETDHITLAGVYAVCDTAEEAAVLNSVGYQARLIHDRLSKRRDEEVAALYKEAADLFAKNTDGNPID